MISRTILLFDGSAYEALDLSAAIEARGCCVAGPVDSLPEAEAIVASAPVSGAIVDGELADASAVVMLLADKQVPFVIQTSTPLPALLAELNGTATVLARPIDPSRILDRLLVRMVNPNASPAIKLGCRPKQV